MNQQLTTYNQKLKLKVCGLSKLDQIRELISLKIDFLGFIFYEKSPRFVLNSLTLDEIKLIDHQGKTGVFVNESIVKIIEISEKASLNFIQLHGDENAKFISELREKLNSEIRIVKVFRIGTEVKNLKSKIQNLKSQIDYFLFDTDSESFGGTGKTFDWNILNEIEIPVPYFLSGGISFENVDDLQNFVKVNHIENKTLTKLNVVPFALDINSKFEIQPGNKNVQKIKEFQSKIQNL